MPARLPLETRSVKRESPRRGADGEQRRAVCGAFALSGVCACSERLWFILERGGVARHPARSPFRGVGRGGCSEVVFVSGKSRGVLWFFRGASGRGGLCVVLRGGDRVAWMQGFSVGRGGAWAVRHGIGVYM